ncbi:hypothetical protein ACJRO7_001485 [Eucalyptus globulus]|uniref:Uncharacterized protein n=1 Tax=Eucalyptus globulus TaxID=34317 RepID=A0ABD3LV29_EUCGL
MMSIFSSFEALCADSHGQKIAFSFFPAKARPPADQSAAPAAAAAEKAKRSAGGEPMPPAPGPPKKRPPRFAPELDGVHCFETILPY